MKGSTRWALAMGALLAALLVPAASGAQVLVTELYTKVVQGQQPMVKLVATAAVSDAVVRLQRDDERTFTFRVGDLSAGASREIALDGGRGRHRWEGALEYHVGDDLQRSPLRFDTVVAAPIRVEVDKANVDLQQRHLEMTVSRPVATVAIKVLGAGNQVLTDERHDISEQSGRGPVLVRWSAGEGDQIVRIELRVFDSDGFFSGVALTPWAVRVPHEEVTFANDSARIGASEEPKLRASLGRIEEALSQHSEIRGVKLFIAGHTDTKGSAEHNLTLSRRRAQAIATWFVKQGLRLPIFFEGFGEHAPKVKTGDEVDEPRNRRADYILSVEEPVLKESSHHARWQAAN